MTTLALVTSEPEFDGGDEPPDVSEFECNCGGVKFYAMMWGDAVMLNCCDCGLVMEACE